MVYTSSWQTNVRSQIATRCFCEMLIIYVFVVGAIYITFCRNLSRHSEDIIRSQIRSFSKVTFDVNRYESGSTKFYAGLKDAYFTSVCTALKMLRKSKKKTCMPLAKLE
jgi:hypothetical protein